MHESDGRAPGGESERAGYEMVAARRLAEERDTDEPGEREDEEAILERAVDLTRSSLGRHPCPRDSRRRAR